MLEKRGRVGGVGKGLNNIYTVGLYVFPSQGLRYLSFSMEEMMFIKLDWHLLACVFFAEEKTCNS